MKKIPISILGNRYGNKGRKIWLMAQGKDIDSMTLKDKPPKSIGHGKVTKPNLKNTYEIKKIFHYMSIKVAKRLRVHSYETNTFIIGIKTRDFWFSEKYKLSQHTNHDKDIFKLCLKLIDNFIRQRYGVYQVQVTAINLEKINNQRDLFFNNQEDKNNIDNMIDSINNKFGELMLRPARLSSEFESPDVISPSWRPKGYKKSL